MLGNGLLIVAVALDIGVVIGIGIVVLAPLSLALSSSRYCLGLPPALRLETQQYAEDCSVCCRPWVVQVSRTEDGVSVQLLRDSD